MKPIDRAIQTASTQGFGLSKEYRLGTSNFFLIPQQTWRR
jgi:hypothetical protein